MTDYEKLLSHADKLGIKVKEIDFECNDECGYYSNNKILINNRISEVQKYAVLAEELGHHHKTVGDITNQNKIENKKQELIARRWGYEQLIGIIDLINAYNYGCENKYEIAKYLNVTENFLSQALEYYSCKYENGYKIDRYWIDFNNGLNIFKKF